MSLLYIFIAIWVSVNGITSPFDDVLSFFMWAAVLVPVIACIFILLNCGDDDRKIEPQHSIERRYSHDWRRHLVLLLYAVPRSVSLRQLLTTKSKSERKIVMSRNELITKIETLQSLEALIEETKAEAETVRNSIKAEMEAANTEELSAGGYIVRWTSVLTTRFDTKTFKEKCGEEVYKAFTKQVSSRRFSISA